MKRMILLGISVLLMFSAVACGNNSKNENDGAVNETSVSSTQNSENKTSAAVEHDDLTPVLEEIRHMEIGTAGSSLKAVAPAASLMEWSAQTEMTEEEIAATVNNFYDMLGEDEKEEFRAQSETAVGTVHSIRAEGGDGILLDAGVEISEDVLLGVKDEKLDALLSALAD